MRRAICLCLLALWPLISAEPSEDAASKEEEKPLIEGAETARILTTFIFPFFPQYADVDMGLEVNKLKSSNTVAFFVIRDTMQVGFSGAKTKNWLLFGIMWKWADEIGTTMNGTGILATTIQSSLNYF